MRVCPIITKKSFHFTGELEKSGESSVASRKKRETSTRGRLTFRPKLQFIPLAFFSIIGRAIQWVQTNLGIREQEFRHIEQQGNPIPAEKMSQPPPPVNTYDLFLTQSAVGLAQTVQLDSPSSLDILPSPPQEP